MKFYQVRALGKQLSSQRLPDPYRIQIRQSYIIYLIYRSKANIYNIISRNFFETAFKAIRTPQFALCATITLVVGSTIVLQSFFEGSTDQINHRNWLKSSTVIVEAIAILFFRID